MEQNLKVKNELFSPTSLSATIGEKEGEIELHWDPVEGANSYAIEISRNGKKLRWQMIDIVGSSKHTVTGLKVSTTYCFRVSALDSKQQGPWSDPVMKKLLRQ